MCRRLPNQGRLRPTSNFVIAMLLSRCAALIRHPLQPSRYAEVPVLRGLCVSNVAVVNTTYQTADEVERSYVTNPCFDYDTGYGVNDGAYSTVESLQQDESGYMEPVSADDPVYMDTSTVGNYSSQAKDSSYMELPVVDDDAAGVEVSTPAEDTGYMEVPHIEVDGGYMELPAVSNDDDLW